MILPESTYYLIMHFLADDWIHFHLIFLVGLSQKVHKSVLPTPSNVVLPNKSPYLAMNVASYWMLTFKVGNTFAPILFNPFKSESREVALFTRNSN